MFGRAKDPVCGAKVKKSTPYQSEWKGRRFYFDCAACKVTFEEGPDRFVRARNNRGFLNRLSEASDNVPKSCHESSRR